MPGRTNDTDTLLVPETDLVGGTDQIGVFDQKHKTNLLRNERRRRGRSPTCHNEIEMMLMSDEGDLRMGGRPMAIDVELGDGLLVGRLDDGVTRLADTGVRSR